MTYAGSLSVSTWTGPRFNVLSTAERPRRLISVAAMACRAALLEFRMLVLYPKGPSWQVPHDSRFWSSVWLIADGWPTCAVAPAGKWLMANTSGREGSVQAWAYIFLSHV